MFTAAAKQAAPTSTGRDGGGGTWPPGAPRAVTMTASAHRQLVDDVGWIAAAAFVSIAVGATEEEPGRMVTETSTRSLARQLGIAKDTATRALSALVRSGYLARLAQPRSQGRFGPARYRVLLPVGVSVSAPFRGGRLGAAIRRRPKLRGPNPAGAARATRWWTRRGRRGRGPRALGRGFGRRPRRLRGLRWRGRRA